ncbi:hypothetical protein LSTR_LSTR002457 [Laodelphax striatellus]|uniref:CHK kinase-like domain-containing protein n=1 Tax=Laodelphax striatellus TaxID=195883 RepID=A0A482X2Q2_LAOST|nr:hypothetical protein LSTR_LSTR002457 [Laodelphax striatellus]
MSTLSLPDYLSEDLICEALECKRVLSVRVDRGASVGEHYLSTLLRLTVDYSEADDGTRKTTSLIIKTFPEGVMHAFIKDFSLNEKEVIASQKVLPSMEELMGIKFMPRSLKCDRSDLLILEDLKPLGFEMVDRISRMDLDHCKTALGALADFHAASFLLHRKNPGLFEEVSRETMYVNSNIFQKSFILNSFKTMSDVFEEFDNLRKYSPRLRKAAENVWDKVVEAVLCREEGLNVFNHGDFWTNNILFKHDDQGQILDTRFVDLQFCRFTSPAFDLQMLFYTSIRKVADIPQLTDVYLQRLNSRLPSQVQLTKENFEKELRRTDCFGLIVAVSLLPICTLDSKKALSFDNVTAEDYAKDFPNENPYAKSLKQPLFIEIIPQFLDHFIDIGAL